MASKKRGLGDRGLAALLASSQRPATEATTPADNASPLKTIPVEFIQRGRYQPRRDMDQDALEELADSIRAHGVMQPIVVRPVADNRYEIIAGERRWRASQMAQLDSILAMVHDVPDEAAIAMALIENIQRENLNPMEEAIALHRLQDEFNLTQQEVADAVGKSRTTITNLLRLMKLSPEVKTLLEHGDIEMGHARALLALEDAQQIKAARQLVSKGMSVRQAEDLVRRLQQPPKPKADTRINPDIARLQDDLSDRLGAAVNIQHSQKGKGKLVIQYNNLDELDGILEKIH